MKAPSTKQAAQKGSSEKGLAAARAFPVRKPEGEEKVKNKGQGKEHSGNNEQAAEFHHRAQEQQEHKKPQSTISCPRSHIVKTRSGNFRRGRIFHLNSRPLTGMGFREKRKFWPTAFSSDKAICRLALSGRCFRCNSRIAAAGAGSNLGDQDQPSLRRLDPWQQPKKSADSTT